MSEAIVRRARSCRGLPYRHMGRTRGGMDCGGLVLHALGGLVDRDAHLARYPYPPDPRYVLRMARRFLAPVERRAAREGDVVLMRFGGLDTHLGVLTSGGVVHADRLRGVVLEDPLRGGMSVVHAFRAGRDG